jgi:hypothetical protein
MCRILGCDHSLDLKEFLDQLNLFYICMCLYFIIDQELWKRKLMYRIMSYDYSLTGTKYLNLFIVLWSYFLLYIFLNIFIVSTI